MLLLDILIATLLLFPWLTQGLALDMAGLRLDDLSDLGIPLLAVALVTEAVRRSSRERWQVALIARPLVTVAQGGLVALQRSPGRIVASAAGMLAALVLLALLWRQWAFANPGFDFGSVIWKLTRGSGAVLIVALAAAAQHRWSGEPWEKSFFVRQAMNLAQGWLRAVERSPARTLWAAAGAAGAVLFWISLSRHWALESHGYDLGIFTNALWNLTQGNGYISSIKGGINLFSDHQSPLFWVLAPLFWTIPRPETLLFTQAFGLAAGGPALFYLARAQFGRGHWAQAALPWLYWLWLPLRNANAFDFHPEVFMLPLFLWAFVGLQVRRAWATGLGVLALLGAFGAKESAGVVAAGIGIGWALTAGADSRRERWLGVALAAAGAALFFFDVKVVPRFFDGEYAYMEQYQRFGGGIAAVLLAPFTQPAYFFSQIINHERLIFLFWTLAPLGFLPLLNWRAAVAVLPPYLMLFLSEGDQRVRVFFHYGIEPGSALFWALPFGLAVFARRFGWKAAGIWMIFWALACLGTDTDVARPLRYSPSAHFGWVAAEAIPCLNTEAATAASDQLIPHLATRRWISYPDRLQQQPSGEPVRCVVTDLDIGRNWPLWKSGVMRVRDSLPQQGYHEAYKCRDFTVHELGRSGCLRCVPNCY